MATKKRKRTRRAASKSLSSGGKRKTTRRRSPARRGFLSDIANPTVIMNGGKFALSAGLGGLAGVHASKMISPTASKLHKGLIILAVGILGNSLGYQNMTAGAIGAMTAQAFPNGLADAGDTNYASDSALADQPIFLSEDGQPMVLEENEDGSSGLRYLEEDEIQMLQEEGAFDEYEEV